MELLSGEKVLKVMGVTRFHFISGMPMSGADRLSMILSQNPRFVARVDTPAERIFAEMLEQFDQPGSGFSGLEPECRAALLRASLDAVHNKRPLESVVFDNNPDWLRRVDQISNLFPLSRFIFMVRDPVRLAADIASDSGIAMSPADLLDEEGPIGGPLSHLHNALNGPNAERVLLIDQARLVADPIRVLDVLYRFLREPEFEHDVRTLENTEEILPKVLRGQRRVVALNGPARKRRDLAAYIPVWRRTPRTEATMLLAETG